MMNRYAVRIGHDFEIDLATVSDISSLPALVQEANRYRSSLRRDYLASAALAAMSFMLLGAAGVGMYKGSFGELHSAWDALMVPITAVLTFYFARGE